MIATKNQLNELRADVSAVANELRSESKEQLESTLEVVAEIYSEQTEAYTKLEARLSKLERNYLRQATLVSFLTEAVVDLSDSLKDKEQTTEETTND